MEEVISTGAGSLSSLLGGSGAVGAGSSSVSSGTRGNSRSNLGAPSNSIGHNFPPQQVKDILTELTKDYSRVKIKDKTDKQRIYGLMVAALDPLGIQAVKSDPDFQSIDTAACPLRLLNLIQKTHVIEIGLIGHKNDALARVAALETLLALRQKQGQSLLSYKDSFVLAVQRMDALKCTKIPPPDELAWKFMTGADPSLYGQCISELQSHSEFVAPDTIDKAYDYMLRHVSASSLTRRSNGALSFHMGSQRSGGGKGKKNTNLTDEELADLKSKSTCRYCDKVGHWEAECKRKKRDQAENSSEKGSAKSIGDKKNNKKSNRKQNRDDSDSNEDSEDEDPISLRAHLDSVLGEDRFRGNFGCSFLVFQEQDDGGESRVKTTSGHIKSQSGPLARGYSKDGYQKRYSGQHVKDSVIPRICPHISGGEAKFVCPQINGGEVTSASYVGGEIEKFAVPPITEGVQSYHGALLFA